jgi:DNA invertase Pin-like site-specific DNA recombinase
MTKHRLTIARTAERKAAEMKPSAAMKEAFQILDNLAARQSAGGKAAAGNSGRKKIPLDSDDLVKRYAAGETMSAMAEHFGVSVATISRTLKSKFGR